jgi:hypothetical protein
LDEVVDERESEDPCKINVGIGEDIGQGPLGAEFYR